MQPSPFDSLQNLFQSANQWLRRTPDRSLNEAYTAALRIKDLEDTHFGGGKVSIDSGNFSRSVQNYFQSELKKNLDIIKIRLAEFKISSSIVRVSHQSITEVQLPENTSVSGINVIDRPSPILRKLRLIDEVLARYEAPKPNPASVLIVSESNQNSANNSREGNLMSQGNAKNRSTNQPIGQQMMIQQQGNGLADNRSAESMQGVNDAFQGKAERPDRKKSLTDKTGVLPRSIIDTVDRIKQELDPSSEEEIVQNFRNSRSRTLIAIRFILLLLIIPLLTQQISKNFFIGPIVDQFRNNSEEARIFLNSEMEEEAYTELRRFEERLRFDSLIGKEAPKPEAEMNEILREKALELEEEFRLDSSDAIKNVFSDIVAAIALALVLIISQREIAALKSFMDQLVYGLSDSAKAFIIILLTDIFVGFHSPHGWEVILEGLSRHFGLPADRNFIFLFIATFPVILDTIFKYWIFRYLNRVSPSAVATYRNMNE